MSSFASKASFRKAVVDVVVAALHGAGALSGSIVVLMFVFIALEAWPVLNDVGLVRFIADQEWHPVDRHYGMIPMLAGTLVVTLIGVALATPIGLACAIVCRFYAPSRVAAMLRTVMQLLAGIPSVVYGFWGLVVLVPLIGAAKAPGSCVLAGGIVLAMMVLPTMALAAESSLAGVGSSSLEAATALGLTRSAAVLRVVMPAARPGLISAFTLQTGRAIGETMAVMMVCGNVVRLPGSIFEPVRTLTANIALEMAYAMDLHRSALFVSGLMLAALIVALVVVADAVDGDDVRS